VWTLEHRESRVFLLTRVLQRQWEKLLIHLKSSTALLCITTVTIITSTKNQTVNISQTRIQTRIDRIDAESIFLRNGDQKCQRLHFLYSTWEALCCRTPGSTHLVWCYRLRVLFHGSGAYWGIILHFSAGSLALSRKAIGIIFLLSGVSNACAAFFARSYI
jgi:hypothetical protein